MQNLIVVGAAGKLGAELLARGDLELFWALSAGEVQAVLRRVSVRVAVVRQWIAKETLPLLTAKHVPSLVLLERGGWAEKEELLALGATALVEAAGLPRAFEALSELTGLGFRRYPRANLETVVEVAFPEGPRLLQSVNMSAGGIAVRDFPKMSSGSGFVLQFVLMDPPFKVKAIVVRSFVERGVDCAGLAFIGADSTTKKRIEDLVEEQAHMDETSDLSPQAAAAEPHALSNIESRLLDGKDTPRWVHRALRLRHEAHEAQRQGRRTTDATMAASIELCRDLAKWTSQQSEADMVEATQFRAAFLGQIYGLAAPDKERRATSRAA